MTQLPRKLVLAAVLPGLIICSVAYLLDHDRFAGVPVTEPAIVDMSQMRLQSDLDTKSDRVFGSVQAFADHVSSAGTFLTALVSERCHRGHGKPTV